jgi:hypothetical protein
MMGYRLSPHLHCCTLGTCSVFLDLDSDRYFLLQKDAGARFQRFVSGCAEVSDLAWLQSRNIIQAGPANSAERKLQVETPLYSVICNDMPRAPLELTAKAIFFQACAELMLKRRPLAQVFSRIASASLPAKPEGYLVASTAAAAFDRAGRFTSSVDKCLIRGIAMKCMLARQGCHVDLIIGVALPFSAHCWVQFGSTVLTDPLDLVTTYKPILVV